MLVKEAPIQKANNERLQNLKNHLRKSSDDFKSFLILFLNLVNFKV